MKRTSLFLLLLVTAVLVQSCSPKLMPRDVKTFYIDYSKYSSEGFLISPNPYPGSFTSLGELLITVIPGDVVVSKMNVFNSQNNFYESTRTFEKEQISTKELLDIAVNFAKQKGANAIVNFKCEIKNYSYYNTALKKPSIYFSHYEISGFAIKI